MDQLMLCRRLKPRKLLTAIIGIALVLVLIEFLPAGTDNYRVRDPRQLLQDSLGLGEAASVGHDKNQLQLIRAHVGNKREIETDSVKKASNVKPAAKFTDGFQEVVREKLWVYSAYVDYRVRKPHIVVFGLMEKKISKNAKFRCDFYGAGGVQVGANHTLGVGFATGALNIDPFHSSVKDISLSVKIPIPGTIKPRDIDAVMIRLAIPDSFMNTPNLLRVRHLIETPDVEVNFTICTSPLFFNYSNVGEFLQMVEVGRLLGVNRFVIYDLSMGETLVPYVRYYQRLGIVEVRPWNIPRYVSYNRKLIHDYIHYFGQVISINDCIYRNMYRTSFVAVLDLDELIVPMKTNDLPSLLNGLDRTSHTYDFKCVFFKKEWPDDELFVNRTGPDIDVIKKLEVTALLKTKREKKVWDHKTRSKEMVRPEVVMYYHIHFVAMYMNKAHANSVVNVPETEALLFHYRYWNSITHDWIVNRRMHSFASNITQRIHKVVQEVY